MRLLPPITQFPRWGVLSDSAVGSDEYFDYIRRIFTLVVSILCEKLLTKLSGSMHNYMSVILRIRLSRDLNTLIYRHDNKDTCLCTTTRILITTTRRLFLISTSKIRNLWFLLLVSFSHITRALRGSWCYKNYYD